jgi:hypothetical protein
LSSALPACTACSMQLATGTRAACGQPAQQGEALRQSVALSWHRQGFWCQTMPDRLAPCRHTPRCDCPPRPGGLSFCRSQPFRQACHLRWWPASASTVHCTPLRPCAHIVVEHRVVQAGCSQRL